VETSEGSTEINNPLMGILNYAELLKDQELDEKGQQFADGVIKEANRVAAIVRNLLSFARQDTESPTFTELRDILESSLSLTGSILRKGGIRIDTDVPEDLPHVRCRRRQIEQVVINLLTNARDALNQRYSGFHEDKSLCIAAREIEKDGTRWLRTTIEDRGPGIPGDIEDRIFDPFFTTKPRDRGTGLGLSVSYGIFKAHAGELWVESELGAYTRFHIDLPLGGRLIVHGTLAREAHCAKEEN